MENCPDRRICRGAAESPAAPGSPRLQGRAARAPNAEQLLYFMTCFTLNSPLEPHPGSAFASSFEQPVFHRALPGCGRFRHVGGHRGQGLPWLPQAARSSTETLSPAAALGRGVHGQPCCHCPLRHPEPSPPGVPAGSGPSPAPHGGWEGSRMGPGGHGLLEAQLLRRHSTGGQRFVPWG